MTAPILNALTNRINRRGFLSSAAATTVCAGVAVAPEHAAPAPVPEVIPIGPPERPRTDIEAWNIGDVPVIVEIGGAALLTLSL